MHSTPLLTTPSIALLSSFPKGLPNRDARAPLSPQGQLHRAVLCGLPWVSSSSVPGIASSKTILRSGVDDLRRNLCSAMRRSGS